jgi:SAM-dependent methyltransferase
VHRCHDSRVRSVIGHRLTMNHAIQRQANRLIVEKAEVCPLCAGRKLQHKFEVQHITGDPLHSWASDQGFSFAPVVACRDCGFLFKSLRPVPGYLHEHYSLLDESYVERVAEELPGFREDYHVARVALQSAFPKGGSILDVGCASGYFLESLGEKWARHGIEIFRVAAQQARARGGISIYECDIASAGFASQSFDVVCSFDVVEHLAEPMGFFQEVRRILKPGGWLLLGTGDSRSFGARLSGSRWTYLCIPEHLSFFNARSLRLALGTAGFSHVDFSRIHHGERSRSAASGWLRGVGKHWAITLCGEKITRLRVFRQKTSAFLIPYFFDHMICIAC